jgi:hypothetical protein
MKKNLRKKFKQARRARRILFILMGALLASSITTNIILFKKISTLEKNLWDSIHDYTEYLEWKHRNTSDYDNVGNED